jgi:hypothetical protein
VVIRQPVRPPTLVPARRWNIISAQPQQPPAPPSAETSSNVSSIRVTTHLVEVNVIVNDKHGNPITGLTKDDFVLLDNKRPQEIQLLSAETNLRRDQPQTPLLPDTCTNRLSEHASVPTGVTVILLDAPNTEFADQALTRKQVLQFLEHLRQQDRVALYWLGNNLYVLNDFTTDVASLREAIARSKGESNRDLTDPVDARGLMGNGVTAAGDYSEASHPGFADGDEHLPTRVSPGNLETMKVLAERTGGKAFYGSNNLSEAIRRAMDDSRLTYTLGFDPAGAK